MEISMGAKDVVRALLDRMPDDCRLEDVIEQIMLLEGPWLDESDLPPLTEAQRIALEESIAHHKLHPERAIPWREALERIGRSR
jgi:hypothetical protein